MSVGLTPAAEGPSPMYAGAPPDQQPVGLEEALQMVDSILWRDGGIDKREEAILGAWFQNTQMKAQMALQQAQQNGVQIGQEQGLGSSSVGDMSGVQDYNAFGGRGSQFQDAPDGAL